MWRWTRGDDDVSILIYPKARIISIFSYKFNYKLDFYVLFILFCSPKVMFKTRIQGNIFLLVTMQFSMTFLLNVVFHRNQYGHCYLMRQV